MRAKEACLRRAVLIILLVSLISACAVQNPQAGQSGPPFELWVLFRPGTDAAVAMKVFSGCRHEPDLIRVGRLVKFHGALRGTVYTKDFGNSARIRPLISCLRAARSVRLTEFPD